MKQKIAITILLLSLAFNVSLRPARADYWGAANGAAFLKQSMEEMYTQIKETIVANLQMAAVKLVMGRIQTLLTGSAGAYGTGSGGSLVITDWQNFIYGTAQKYSTQITNDFFTTVSSGVSSTLKTRVLDPAQNAVKGGTSSASSTSSTTLPKPDLDSYVSEGKGENIFASGTSANKAYANFLRGGNPQNSVETYYILAKEKDREAFRQKEEQQKSEGVAGQGYKSVDKSKCGRGSYTKVLSTGEKVTVEPSAADCEQKIATPASSVKSLTDTIVEMPMKILENAKSIPQVVTAMITSTITSMLNQGLAKVTEPIDSTLKGYSLSQMQSNVQSGINSSLKK